MGVGLGDELCLALYTASISVEEETIGGVSSVVRSISIGLEPGVCLFEMCGVGLGEPGKLGSARQERWAMVPLECLDCAASLLRTFW